MVSLVRLEANGPWDHNAALRSLAIHQINGLEAASTGESRHRRILFAGGEPIPVSATLDPKGVTLETGTGDQGINETLARTVRFWFDLDADLNLIDTALRGDGILGKQVEERPGVRVTRFTAGFEAVALTVLGQQVTLAAARGYGSRLVAQSGTDGPGGLRIFPGPGRIASEDHESLRASLRATGARTRTLQSVARLFADGFQLGASSGFEVDRQTLLGVKGIGPWTVDYLSIRALNDPDRFPGSDAVIRRALGGATPNHAAALAEKWSPWRSYAAMRLWAREAEN